ncbi:hypothetical protein FJTKL_03526 [Diaporthe vaccinii]|uniref:Uncharacterized protein n=1 Tax=Diaporthe vaccinii TaxID=105482 RepID=A0ABR4DVE6_9PEZI
MCSFIPNHYISNRDRPSRKRKHPNSQFKTPAFCFAPYHICGYGIVGDATGLSAGVDDVAADNGALGHLVEYALQLAEADGLEGGVDEAAGEEVERLLCVRPVADVAALDGDHADDALEDGGRDASAGGQADADDGSTGPDDGGVGAQAVGGGGLDVGDEVLGGEEVDVGRGAQLLGGLALLIAAVDGDGVNSHGLAVLQGHVAQATTGAGDSDPLAGADTGLLDSLVDSDTSAEDGCDGLEADALGDAGNVGGLGDSVLLEGAVDGVTRKLGIGTKGLVGSHTVRAGQAGAVEPLDADLIALLQVLDEVAAGDYNTSTLVATDEGHLDGQGPVALHGVQVGVAHTRELDIDQDLIGAGLGDGDLLVLKSCKLNVSLGYV